MPVRINCSFFLLSCSKWLREFRGSNSKGKQIIVPREIKEDELLSFVFDFLNSIVGTQGQGPLGAIKNIKEMKEDCPDRLLCLLLKLPQVASRISPKQFKKETNELSG